MSNSTADSEAAQAQCLGKCEEYRRAAFSNSTVRFMMEALKRSGCPLTPDMVSCTMCEDQIIGGMQVNPQGKFSILLCANHLRREESAVETTVHEMVHSFDACRAKVDWTNPAHRACSEIRAANLSGDCTFIREVERFVSQKKYAFPLFKQQQACVRRRAVLSMIGSPGCPDEAACESAVDSVWDTCYNDIAPFARAP